jgi:hypothetical protein
MNGRIRNCAPNVAQLGTDQDLRAVLVDDHQAGRGDDVGVADAVERLEKGPQVAVQEGELQPVVEADLCQVGHRRAGGQAQMVLLAEPLEVDAELVVIVQPHAEDHGLDGHLRRLLVQFGDDLVDGRQHRLVVLYQQGIRAGVVVPFGVGPVFRDLR